jgi:hypothetical protein
VILFTPPTVAFLRRHALPLGAVAAVIVVGSLAYQHFRGPSGLSPEVRDSLAVLKASRTPDSMAHAVVVAKAETTMAQSAALTAASRAIERNAAALRTLADHAVQLAAVSKTAQDSATHYHEAFLVERRRGDSLQIALTDERSATDRARESARAFHEADSLSRFRLARIEKLNSDLERDVARVSAGCQLFFAVSCPTRKQTAVAAAAIGAGVVLFVKNRKP